MPTMGNFVPALSDALRLTVGKTSEPAVASDQTIRGQRKRAVAVWSAIERACDREDFRPNVGPLCDYCNFKSSCPAFAA